MARCFSCGKEIPGGGRYWFTCPDCQQVEEIKTLREEIPKNIDDLAQVQRRGFEALSDELAEVASIIRWGFEEASWQIQQQTDLLRSIDRTLKTPSETQANEWRKMAEELRSRGVLDKSERKFLKALESNPLDYRIYIGLAETYLKMEKFDKAKSFLEKSLPHAPPQSLQPKRRYQGGKYMTKEEVEAFLRLPDETREKPKLDYKSYSYRLIGRIYFCKENYQQAVSALDSAIELSPTYHPAIYDHAQYCALIGNKEDCLTSLKNAIKMDSFYFYLAQKERNFESIREEVRRLLKEMEKKAYKDAHEEISQAKEALKRAREAWRPVYA